MGDEHGLSYSAYDPKSQMLRSEPVQPSMYNTSTNLEWNNPQGTSLSSTFTSSTNTGASSMPYQNSLYYFLGEDLLDDEKWYYKDPKGQERGPFGGNQMDKWVKYDFFKVDLFVRREYKMEFIHLGDIFLNEQRNPFSGEPLMEWFQGPSSEFKTSLMLLIQNFLLNRISRTEIDTSTSATATSSGFIPPAPGYYTTISNMSSISNIYSSATTNDSTPTPVTTNNTSNQEAITVPSEITRPNWWESSDAIPKRNPNPKLDKPSTTSSETDWEHLQQKQTETLQKVLEGMKQANEELEKKNQQLQTSKKKKGKKKPQEPQATSVTTSKKKSDKQNNTQYRSSGSNNTQPRSQPSENKSNNKPQIARQPIQTGGKPKPQYKLKDSPPLDSPTNPNTNPNSNPIPSVNSNPAVTPSSPSQPKRLHSKPQKVWKVVEKKDEVLNQEQDQHPPNIEHPGEEEKKTTQGHS
jgi:hypothetical protein